MSLIQEALANGQVVLDIEAVVFRCTCPDRGVALHDGQPCPNAEAQDLGVIATSKENHD